MTVRLIDKHADDTVLIGHITVDDDTRQEIDIFFQRCDQNFLEFNVRYIKEMLMEIKKQKCA